MPTSRPWRRRRAGARRSGVQQADQGARRRAGSPTLLRCSTPPSRTPRLRGPTWSSKRSSRTDGQKVALCPAGTAAATDAILASNTSTIPITQLAEGLARPERFLRHPLFQSGPQDAAGRSDSRPRDQRRNRGHGRGLCQEHRQVADRGSRWAGLSGQSAAVPVSERVARTARRRSARSKRSNGRPKNSACRWARWPCTTWSGSTLRSTPAA